MHIREFAQMNGIYALAKQRSGKAHQFSLNSVALYESLSCAAVLVGNGGLLSFSFLPVFVKPYAPKRS